LTRGFTASSFDLFHSGHVAMLKEARANCDYMIVGLQTKPIQSVFERYVQLEGCKYIDEIIPYESEKDLTDIFLTYGIDVRFIGEEYKDKDFTAKQICVDKNIKIHYNKRQHSFSTTNLRKRIKESE
jgi:glycerol-3-phosphate cytidylyltransferase